MKKALLVIDVQKEYMKKYDEDLLSCINSSIQTAANNGSLIVYIKNVKRLRSGDKCSDFADDLKVCSTHVFLKKTASAFSNNDLNSLLEEYEINELEMIGVDGNYCVASTAVEARKLGYSVKLLCGSIGVQNRERFEQRQEILTKNGVEVVAI